MRNFGAVVFSVSVLAFACSDDTAVGNRSDVTSFQQALTGAAGAGTCPQLGFGGGLAKVMQAELLPVADISPGDAQYILNGSPYCNSQSRWLAADAPGDYITYGPISYSSNMLGRVWDVQLRAANTSVAGKIRLSYGLSSTGPWTDLLAPLDLYSATSGPQIADLGGIVFQDTPTFIHVAVVGKNAASSGYNVNVDWLAFLP